MTPSSQTPLKEKMTTKTRNLREKNLKLIVSILGHIERWFTLLTRPLYLGILWIFETKFWDRENASKSCANCVQSAVKGNENEH